MADMTSKHHTLIFDAIEHGLGEFIKTPVFSRFADSNGPAAKYMVESLAKSLGSSFAEKLRYTNDKFESGPFSHQVASIGSDLGRKIGKSS